MPWPSSSTSSTAHSPAPPYHPTAGGTFDLVYRNWRDGQYPVGDILPAEFVMGETAADNDALLALTQLGADVSVGISSPVFGWAFGSGSMKSSRRSTSVDAGRLLMAEASSRRRIACAAFISRAPGKPAEDYLASGE